MCMWQLIKTSLWVLLLASGLQSSWAYSLGGPIGNGGTTGDEWQKAPIGYGLPGDLNAPKNIGEEFRRNTPVVYYTFDANFLDYFGSNGVTAVRSAMAVLNALTNVDNYSKQLSEFPLESRHVNYTAQTLGLYDMKSFTLGAMMEQLGLADPVRYAWTLHDRIHVTPGPPCPQYMQYFVVQRNYDFVSSPLNQLQYSPYVNNTLFDYQIDEVCLPPNPLALAVPFAVDPLADTYSAVAGSIGGTMYLQTPSGLVLTTVPGITSYGSFYTGLTLDDVAGLRYLFTTNNINFEDVAPGALLVSTNLGPLILLTSSNLNSLLTSAQANPPAAIPGLFPGVVVASSSNYYAYVCTTNLVASIPNQAYGAPYPNNFGALVVTPVVNCGFQQQFSTTFANIITNGNLTNNPNITLASPNIKLSYSTNSLVYTLTTSLAPKNGQPYPPSPVTNSSFSTTTTSVPSGEYLILPAGACGFNILAEATNPPIYTTNFVSTATNANGFVDTISTVTIFTNHTFVVQPINCVDSAPAPGLYEGIGRVQFVEADFDSLLGQSFQPFTNHYTMTLVTNSQAVVQKFQRVVTQPDFLFSAFDITSPNPPAVPSLAIGQYARNLTFDQAHVLPNLAGPGTITTPTTISFNKVGPVYLNGTFNTTDILDGSPYFNENPGSDITDTFFAPYFIWASFDGTTNAPVVYPDGTSIDNLENQVLIQLSPTTLPGGFSGVPYGPVTISATGGAFTQPYTWSASGLPSGLTIVSNPDSTATLSGTPTQSGTFDIILILTDYVGRPVQWGYTITIQ
jgi:hypothetical protein